MKSAALRSAVAAVVLTAAGAEAQEQKPVWVFEGGVGLENHYQSYVETVQSTTFMKQDGWFGGVTLEGRLKSDRWQLRGELRYAWGEMDYSGSGTANGIDDTVFEGRALLAHVFPTGDGRQFIPYVGFGYRRLEDNFGGVTTSTGALGYDRISQYYYIPIGLESILPLGRGWHLKPTIEFDYFLKGTQTSRLSTVLAGLSDLENDQGSGYGLRGSLTFASTILRTPVEFGPFIRYWNIDESDVATISFRGRTVARGLEPANETFEAGLALKLWY